VTVRRLRAGDDCSHAALLLQRFFAEEGFDTPASIIAARVAQMAGIDQCGLFVAEEGGQAVAVATCSMEFGIEFGWWAEMGDLYVVPEWRGQGLSRQLVAAIEAYARAGGATGYQVTVTPFGEEHMGLKAFYRAMGFADDGRLLLFKTL